MIKQASTDFGALFSPRSIAVVGATATAGKPGRIVLENLLGGSARLYAIHPSHREVLGVPALPDLVALPEVVDLVVVAVGAEQTLPVVESAVQLGVPFVIALAGGFAEAGEAGRVLQDQLVQSLAGRSRAATRLLGPNTLGVQVPGSGLDTIFVEHATETLTAGAPASASPTPDAPTPGAPASASPTAGGVAVISQSGSVAVEALGAAALHRFPLLAFVGLGNAIDLQSSDFISYFSRDESAGTICVYLEHLGEGRGLLDVARTASRRGPIFFLKAGRTAAGAAAAASHTGRLAGSDRVVDGAFRQYGIQRVRDDEALFDAARAVTYAPVPRGNRVAIITPAGGYGVMGVDYVEAVGTDPTRGRLQLAQLQESTREALARVCLPFASVNNPVDLTAGVDNESFARAVELLLQDPGVDILIVMAFLAPAGLSEALIGMIGACAAGSDRSVLVFCRSGERTEEFCRAFTDAGLPAYNSLSRTIEAARVLVARRDIMEMHARRTSEAGTGEAGTGGADAGEAGSGEASNGGAGNGRASTANASPEIAPEIGRATARATASWLARFGPDREPSEADVKELLRSCGIAVPRSVLVPPGGPGAGAAGAPAGGATPFPVPDFPEPWVVKVASPRILHKTEAGAVRLNVTVRDLPEVIAELQSRFPDEAILLEEMVKGISVELIAGALRDADLGPALMLGAGGTLAELYRDVAFRLVPCSAMDVEQMMDELALSPLLSGYRGIATDRNALRECLLQLSLVVDALGDRLDELDINPLCYADGRWVALDAKVRLSADLSGG